MDENKSCGFFSVTLRVGVRIGVSASGHTQQRLRADAAQVHFVDVRHHAGHHSLVEQSRACNLETDGGRQLLLRCAVPVLCCAVLLVGCCLLLPVPGVRKRSASSGMTQSDARWAASWPQGILGGSPATRPASAPSVWQSCGYLTRD